MQRKAKVYTKWFGVTDRVWPWGFWFEVGYEVKTRRVDKHDYAEIGRIVRKHERKARWQSKARV